MLVFVGQIEHEEPLPRNVEHMNPHKGVEDPPGGGVLEALAFVVRQGGGGGLARVAHAVCSGRIDEPIDGHHHAQGPNPLGLFEREGRGQPLQGFAEATAPCRPGWPCLAVEHRLGGSLLLIQCVCREEKTALLGDAGLSVREPRRQSSCNMVDELVGLGSRAWSPPLPIVWRRAHSTVMEQCGLPAGRKTGERLLGLRCPGQCRPA
jgi:hypothetical protein